MAGARQKDRADLVNPRGGRDRRAEATPDMPELRVVTVTPEGLRPEAVAVWEETIPLAARNLVPTDMFHVRRWIFYVNEWFQLADAVVKDGYTVMQEYGEVLNPKWRAFKDLEANIVRMEEAMGLNPRARMRLGITFAKEQTALEKLKAGASKPRPGRLAPAKAGV